jgi:hypothetical protein
MNNGNRPPVGPFHPGLAADYLKFDPITGRPWLDLMGYSLEQLRMRPERDTALARGQACAVPAGIRPLQGLQPNQRGQCVTFAADEFDVEKSIFRIAPLGDDSEMISINFGLEPQESDEFTNTNDAFFQSTLRWGVGGASYEATVDVLRGTSIQLPCNQLSVSVVRRGSLGGFGSRSLPYRVCASAGYSSIGRASTPSRFTDRLGVIPDGFSSFSTIPPFATSFAVMLTPTAAQPPSAQVAVISGTTPFDAAVGSFQLYQVTNTTNLAWNNELMFPIAGPGRFVQIINDSGGNEFVQVLYALAL